jgi:hypothetical protein
MAESTGKQMLSALTEEQKSKGVTKKSSKLVKERPEKEKNRNCNRQSQSSKSPSKSMLNQL